LELVVVASDRTSPDTPPMRTPMRMLSAVSVALTLPALVSGSCSNGCGKRGFCTTAFTCQCQDGFYGPECAERTCPKGRQWQGYATTVDTVHVEEAECSNMGVCDRSSGTCKCHASFDGKACERLACPAGQCSGHGKCRSIAEAAEEVDNWHLLVSTTYSLWDKDKIHGCVCDKGWRGYDCSERECMYGDDPMTLGGSEEVQILECTCASTCSGGVVLDVYGEKTGLIAHDASAADVANAFKAIDAVPDISVVFSGSATTLCSAAGTAAIVNFTSTPGNVPTMLVHSSLATTANGGVAALTVTASGAVSTIDSIATIDGSREYLECSNQGTCNRETGECVCRPGMLPSDGSRSALNGTRMDCGSFGTSEIECYVLQSIVTYRQQGYCSGHGRCDRENHVPTTSCICNPGYSGPFCMEKMCPLGISWFSAPTTADVAHGYMECSNNGICQKSTGTCACRPGFEGVACDKVSCPVASAAVCSGHGSCHTISQLAGMATGLNDWSESITYGASATAATWDASLIQGCHCLRHYYFGPYLSDVGDYFNYACGQAYCATGDDPYTEGQVVAVQKIVCDATAGQFRLKFRADSTELMDHEVPLAELKRQLENLNSIGSISIAYDPGEFAASGQALGLCNVTSATITFNSEFGALPTIAAVPFTDFTGGTMTTSSVTTGTKENVECSNRGLCDRVTGQCTCYPGYGSSDGFGNVGLRNDCGRILPVIAGL